MEGIHLRLREGKDDDIADWYSKQPDRSAAVRDAIRAQIRLGQSGQDAIIRQAVAQGLAQLPDVVASAIQSALAEYRLAPAAASSGAEVEDPELAASLDEQLEGFL